MTRDRFGEPVEPDDVPEQPHRCDKGFLDRDADPPLQRCPVCKPHLAPEIREAQLHGPYIEHQPPREENP